MIKCNLCGFQEIELLYIKNKFEIVKCKNCGLIFVSNPPNSSLLQNEYYNKDYYQGKVYKNYLGEACSRIRDFKKRIKAINKLYPCKGKLLDVGCALDFFLQAAKEEGWNVYGMELSKEASLQAQEKGFKVIQGDFCKIVLVKEKFDVVTFWDCIEHLEDPKGALLKANQLLKESGVVVISTGNIDSIDAKISRDKWDLLYPPYHLYFFSQDTLNQLLGKTGFQIIKIDRNGGNVLNPAIFERIIANKYLNYFLVKIFGGDIITVYAKKL